MIYRITTIILAIVVILLFISIPECPPREVCKDCEMTSEVKWMTDMLKDDLILGCTDVNNNSIELCTCAVNGLIDKYGLVTVMEISQESEDKELPQGFLDIFTSCLN
jgi:hypothetical protein